MTEITSEQRFSGAGWSVEAERPLAGRARSRQTIREGKQIFGAIDQSRVETTPVCFGNCWPDAEKRRMPLIACSIAVSSPPHSAAARAALSIAN